MRQDNYMCAIFFNKISFFIKIEETLDRFNLSDNK